MRADTMRRQVRACALAAAVLLSGCAALQIDVDVYKGPLINNEDMQRDQVVSMAMSAKPLLLELRNKLLDGLSSGWVVQLGLSAEARRAALQPQHFDQLAALLPTVAGAQMPTLTKHLRSARQLNDVLTFYDDRGSQRLLHIVKDITQQEEKYDDLLESLKGQRQPSLHPNYTRAHDVQARIWTDLLELLFEVTAAAPPGQASLDALEPLVAELADRIAERTQPWLVACALRNEQPLPAALEGLRNLAEQRADGREHSGNRSLAFARSERWNDTRYHNARRALSHALRTMPGASALALRQIDGMLRVKPPAACLLQPSEANDRLAALGFPSEIQRFAYGALAANASLPSRVPQGAVRQPQTPGTGSGDDEAEPPQSLEQLLTRTSGLSAGGFDHGRISVGIDNLASSYAGLRDRANRLQPDFAVAATQRAKSDAEFRRLEHMLVDFAARMQFLALNLWLVDDAQKEPSQPDPLQMLQAQTSVLSSSDGQRYKTMLEAVSNNLLVHADDLRSRAKFRERQAKQGPVDRAAAHKAFDVTADGAYTVIERQVRQRQTQSQRDTDAAVKREADIQALSAEVSLLKGQLDRDSQAWQARNKRAVDLASLATSLNIGQPKRAKGQLDNPLDTRAQLTADATSAAQALQGDGSEVGFEELRQALLAKLKNHAAIYAGAVTAGNVALPSRAVRLNNAVAALDSIKAADALAKGLRKAKVKEFQDFVLQNRAAATTLVGNKPEPSKELAQAETDLANKKKQSESARAGLTGADLQAVLKLLDEAKPEVLKQVSALATPADLDLVKTKLRSHLDKAEKAATKGSPEHARLLLALQTLDGLPVLDAVQLAALAADATSLDVLDNVIAQLRYAAIEKRRTLGPDNEATKFADAALKRAMKDREQQIYIRPSSTYLRSVYTATSVQADPRLGWRNLLLDRFKQLLDFENRPRETLVELDKAFWQNINTVRVTAAGDSNFTLAKDDVGNWYVKAMGADPKAMIEAAKGMALYNLGGRFDANLLRIDELRHKADALEAKGETVPDGLRSELAGLSGPNSGAGVGARNQTLELFVKNYDAKSVAQLKDLAARLSAGVYTQALQDRWASSLQGSANVRALDGLFNDANAASQLRDATVAAAGEAGAADPAKGMVKALQELNSLRGTLKALVQGHTGLVATELAAQKSAHDGVTALRTKVQEADKLVVAADASLTIADTDFKKLEAGAAPPAQVNVARATYEQARALAGQSRAALKVQTDLLAAEQTKLADAELKLAAAQKRQQSAVADVDAVLKVAVEDFANQRLRVVEETETAVKVIGQATP